MVVTSSAEPTRRKPVRKIGTMVLVSAVCGVLVAGLLLPVASLVGLSTRNLAAGFENLPLELDREPFPQRTTVLDSKGDVLAYFYNQNRKDVPLKRVAPVMQRAIIAIEDSRYYEHGAIDVRGTLRAFVNNAAADGSTQGGSSITQQLVKQILVTQADNDAERAAAIETTYARKLRELQYALAYEREYSKKKILESYLNIAYFGDGAYGIQEAAQHYFSVDADELDLRQSAMIAGLVKNPTAYDPTRFPDEALTRRNIVLARMAELGLIGQRRANRTIRSGLGLDLNLRPNGCVSTKAPFFCLYVQNYLLEEEALGATAAERQRTLNEGGLTISTTLDLAFQRAANAAVRERVDATDQAVASMAMVQPGTGEVRAIAQSRPVGAKRRAGQTYLNYSVPKEYGNANGFQPGSTMKLFVVAAALEQGLPLSTSFSTASPYQLPSGTTYEDCNGDPWSGSADVSNSTGDGTFDMTTGTQQSVNIYFMKLEELTGMCKPVTLARKMGLDIPEDGEVPSFALGVADASPVAMASAYATFAARGIHCSPHPVTEVRDREGDVLVAYTGDCRRLLKEASADAINQILRGVQETGFGVGNQLSVPSAAKTGTTQSNVAVWYAGYTKTMANAAVIAGVQPDGDPTTLVGKTLNGTTLGFDSVSGSGLAGPMWASAMRRIEDRLPDRSFPAPDTSKLGGATTQVPSTGGLSITDAQATLEAAGFSTVVGGYVDSSYPSGTVAYTSPSAYAEGYEGQVVTIYQSTGYVPPPPDDSSGDDDSDDAGDSAGGGDSGDGNDGDSGNGNDGDSGNSGNGNDGDSGNSGDDGDSGNSGGGDDGTTGGDGANDGDGANNGGGDD
jgi:membrane peptidoglycan carboxypeptidase